MQTNHRHCLSWIGRFAMAGWTAVFFLGLATSEDPAPNGRTPTSSRPATVTTSPEAAAEVMPRVSLEVARDRARLMHAIYEATLEAMHQRYFHGERAMVPARALEDVFKVIERQNHVESRWISASFSPMSIRNEPKSEFETQASRKIAKGEDGIETIEDGFYRRAGSIPLHGGCAHCHAGFFSNTSPSPKFAGLIISIPVDSTATLIHEASQPSP